MMIRSFWMRAREEVLRELGSSVAGLSSEEARRRLKLVGTSLLKPKKETTLMGLFFRQFKSPLIVLLLLAAALSLFLADRMDAGIILAIVMASGLLSFFQEKGATDAVEKLLKIVEVRSQVLRDGKEVDVPVEGVVPGDILILNAGDLIPGDCLVLESRDLFVNESTLTGEAFAVEKKEGQIPDDTPVNKRSNTLYMGSHLLSGTGKAVVICIGKETEFGKVAEQLKKHPKENSFAAGIRKFGYFLMIVTLILTSGIFVVNIVLGRPFLESLMFALALAVGLTPQLLPAIISVNLAHGAKRMAKSHVIVKRLASIENLGSMDILCTDKTGTITKGEVKLHSAIDFEGNPAEKVYFHAYLNAAFESGYTNPIDESILKGKEIDLSSWTKCDEIPYDFERKRITILAKGQDGKCLITCKGALLQILSICAQAERADGSVVPINEVISSIDKTFEKASREGFRAIAVAYCPFGCERLNHEDEKALVFLGFLLFFDPPKDDIVSMIGKVKSLGVDVKILTGDHHLVASNIAERIGLKNIGLISGEMLSRLDQAAFKKAILENSVFAEVDPLLKEKIITGLRGLGHTVGYLGDGVNDATALHAADVSISVNTASDVDKSIADIILLKKELYVLAAGIQEGRRTFANSLKYIFMATSANFGNMFSMAGASLFLPFLPLLPKQILLTNLLTDCPEMMIATDSVDKQMVERPLKWDLCFIRRFMIVFGLISSIFDYVTFGVLLLVLHAGVCEFRTGWFVESVISASFITLVIRTRSPFFKSRPSRPLTLAVLLTGLITCLLPYTPLAAPLGFTTLPFSFLLIILAIMLVYILFVELAKKMFYKHYRSK